METSAEGTKLQHVRFLSLICKKSRDKFLKFKWKENRLDEFMGIYLHRNEKYQHFWYVCKAIFVSSYGQSSVERGFSVNKDLLVENLNQQTLIGQRKVYYYFSSLGIGIHEYEILLGLTKRCKSAYSRYTTDALNKDVEKYSFEAEDKEDLSILSKANAIQKTVMEKQKSIKSLNSAIAKLEKECEAA